MSLSESPSGAAAAFFSRTAATGGKSDRTIQDAHRDVLELIAQHLAAALASRDSGTLVFEIGIKDGGVAGKWTHHRIMVR